MATKKTSKTVASKAAKVLKDETSTPDEKAVAASALAQVEVPKGEPLLQIPVATARVIATQLQWGLCTNNIGRGHAAWSALAVLDEAIARATDPPRI